MGSVRATCVVIRVNRQPNARRMCTDSESCRTHLLNDVHVPPSDAALVYIFRATVLQVAGKCLPSMCFRVQYRFMSVLWQL